MKIRQYHVREVLDVIYSNEGDTLVIPALRPGEYADFFLARTIDSSMKMARQKLHEDKRYINTPRIEVASHVGGLIKVKNIIECPSQDTDLRHYY